MSLISVSRAGQLHIGIFGKRNSGKSTLVNALTGYGKNIAEPMKSISGNPLFQAIEIEGIGACILIDTIGFDDDTYLEEQRAHNIRSAMKRTDIALIVCSDEDIEQEIAWAMELKARKAPVVMVINKIDQITNTDKIRNKIHEALKLEPLKISAISRLGIEKIKEELVSCLPEVLEARGINEEYVKEGDLVLLILPKDSDMQDGEEKLLPHEHLMRELFNMGCTTLTTKPERYEEALSFLSKVPELIIAEEELTAILQNNSLESTVLTYDEILI